MIDILFFTLKSRLTALHKTENTMSIHRNVIRHLCHTKNHFRPLIMFLPVLSKKIFIKEIVTKCQIMLNRFVTIKLRRHVFTAPKATKNLKRFGCDHRHFIYISVKKQVD